MSSGSDLHPRHTDTFRLPMRLQGTCLQMTLSHSTCQSWGDTNSLWYDIMRCTYQICTWTVVHLGHLTVLFADCQAGNFPAGLLVSIRRGMFVRQHPEFLYACWDPPQIACSPAKPANHSLVI